MANLSQPEATDVTTGSATQNPPPEHHDHFDDHAFSFAPITLKRLHHLSEYLQNLQPTSHNPLDRNPFFHPSDGFYITSSDVVLRHIVCCLSSSGNFASPSHHLAYIRAGPRKHIFFEPSTTRAVIVTCGGLCPGMNTVLRELVVGLWDLYGVRQIYGTKAGYRGF